MESLAVISFFSGLIVFFLMLVVGILLIRHRQLIMYFKSAFTFIREDYDAEEELVYGSFLSDMFDAFRFGCYTLGMKAAKGEPFGINRSIVLLGKLLVFYSFLGILLSFFVTIIMINVSNVNTDMLNGFFRNF